MGEFEELRKMGTKLSRAAETELQKKKQQLDYEENRRRKEEEAQRRRKEQETQKLIREELDRKKHEEEQRKRDAAAQLRAKERARERERELEREKELEKSMKKQQQRTNPNAPTYSRSSKAATYSGSASSRSTYGSSSYDSKAKTQPQQTKNQFTPYDIPYHFLKVLDKTFLYPVAKKSDYSFDNLQKIAQANGVPSRPSNRTEDRHQNGDRDIDRSNSRQAAVDRLKVNRGVSPERKISSAQSFTGSRIAKKPPVRRSTGPKSPFPPVFRSPGAGVNHVRDAGLKAIREGPTALNTKKRDLRTVEEISAELREKDARRDERERKIKEIEESREQQRQHRERVLQAAKYSRALMGNDANETEKIFKEITGAKKARPDSRSPSPNKSPRRRGRSQSPAQRNRSPPRRKRSTSPISRRRGNSPNGKRRSSVSPRRRRSASPPPKRKVGNDYGADSRMGKSKMSNGSGKRRVSSSPSPSPPPRSKKSKGRDPFGDHEDFSVSSVIGSIFGTRYRAMVEDEDLSDMEARPDEVFREEARSARIAKKEDEMEAELERAQLERARKRKMERERNR
ncbi:hypothetical protein BGZ76_006902 [Entomortierella beljakovae]|nr:hypothetical protein BGZ76_006902 [Entomortierella beljakovae]